LNLAWLLIGNLIQNAPLEWIVCDHNCSLDQRDLISVYLLSSIIMVSGVVAGYEIYTMASYILLSKIFPTLSKNIILLKKLRKLV
jgi:hypothetical protein